MQSSSVLTINLSAIQRNLKCLIDNCGHLMIMVKANAYGTDPIALSQFIHTLANAKIPFLGVSHVYEAMRLREAGITLPIFVISIAPWEAEHAALYCLTAAVSHQEEIEALNEQGKKHKKILPVHLHLDTGMNRSGSSLENAKQLYTLILKASHLNLEGIWTHFVGAQSSAFDPFTQEQIDLFKGFLEWLPTKPKWVHIANSAGAVRIQLPFCNLARVGLGLVGYGPKLPGMESSLSLTTSLIAIKTAQKGESVGYNRAHTIVKPNTRVGVIPFGYFDGFPRSLSGQGYVLICQKKAPIIGTVCMDFTMIDLTEVPEAKIGEKVTLFNRDLSPETLADWAKVDVREILVHLNHRVKRIWIDDPTDAKRFSNPSHSLEKSTPLR